MMFYKAQRMLKHLWLDASDARRALGPDLLEQLSQRVAASEHRHSGQIRICVEAALPMSYLIRLDSSCSLDQLVRERAVALFGKLRVWDTELNNGVLIYLQLAERAIEIIADRGLSRHVAPLQWQALTQRMCATFGDGQFDHGLMQAVDEVTELLVAHFPSSGNARQKNELPDEPFIG